MYYMSDIYELYNVVQILNTGRIPHNFVSDGKLRIKSRPSKLEHID